MANGVNTNGPSAASLGLNPNWSRPTNKDAMDAIQTLHRYYSQPAMDIPPSMMEVLGQSFCEVIKEDPYKK